MNPFYQQNTLEDSLYVLRIKWDSNQEKGLIICEILIEGDKG